MRGLTTDEWRARLARYSLPWEPVTVRLDELEALVARMEAAEEWARKNNEGDGLRRVIWPKRR